MNVKLKPGETLNHDTGEITKPVEKSAEQILAEITGGVSADEKVAVAGIVEDLEAKRAQVAAELAEVRGTDDVYPNLTVAPVGEQIPTDWQPGINTPAHEGEYEVLHPITGMIFRAEYDPMFEWWSCDYQYPTWRGLRGPAA